MHSNETSAANVKAAEQRTIVRIGYGSLILALFLAILAYRAALLWLASGGAMRGAYPALFWGVLAVLALTYAHRNEG